VQDVLAAADENGLVTVPYEGFGDGQAYAGSTPADDHDSRHFEDSVR
jgi:hypothetical protein